MDLSLAHAPMAWDPRVLAGEAELLPHKLSSRLIIQLLLALPFPMEWITVSVPLWYKGFGKGFRLRHRVCQISQSVRHVCLHPFFQGFSEPLCE